MPYLRTGLSCLSANSSVETPTLHYKLNQRQTIFFMFLFTHFISVCGEVVVVVTIISWRKCDGDRCNGCQQVSRVMDCLSLLRHTNESGRGWHPHFSTAARVLTVYVRLFFSVLYLNKFNKDNRSLSRFHTHKVQTTSIQFGSSTF